MNTQQSSTLFTNVKVFDGTGSLPIIGEVLVEGNRITRVERGNRYGSATGAKVINGDGAFLMPGMTEAHTHFSWNDQPNLTSIQMMPPEEHILWCVRVAKRYLEAGWTSCFGAATAKPRLDVVLRNAINLGEFPGPRYLAASQELTTAGGLGDEARSHLPFEELSFGVVVSGPEGVRAAARRFMKYGVDTLKINLSGEYIAGIPAEFTPFSDEEISMLVREARVNGKRIAAHARSCESIKQCMRHGIDIIFHASFTDEEALDLMEARKDKIFVAPGLAWLINTSYHASEWGITPEIAEQMGYHRELEHAIASLKAIHKRGIRILPGGDYGFAWTKHGTNAKDLEYFVKYLGFSNMEALISATSYGAQLMMNPDELGKIQPGFLADVLLVDGDPLADISVLQDHDRILAVMKDGVFYKEPRLQSEHGTRDRVSKW
jgi:imidazolonepropionase-like amidohydrolase